MTCGSRAGSDPICCHGSREDLRSVWPAPRLAGITGYRPASCGDSRPIPVRDLRGMEISRRRLRPVGQQKLPICRDFGGSDGTRTRDLRRDRPSRGQRRPTTTPLNIFICRRFLSRGRLRSAWLSQSSDRRLGHEWATKSCLRGQQRASTRKICGATCRAEGLAHPQGARGGGDVREEVEREPIAERHRRDGGKRLVDVLDRLLQVSSILSFCRNS
jgi:hypothetical protein